MTRNALAPLMAEAELQSAILDACGYLGLPVMHINDSRGQIATDDITRLKGRSPYRCDGIGIHTSLRNWRL